MNELNELIEKIEALPDRDQLIWADPFIKIADLKNLATEFTNAKEELAFVLNDWNELVKAIGAKKNGTAVGHAKSLAAELALANKKLEILQASNDHYADVDNAIWRPCTDGVCARQDYYSVFSEHRNGFDFARKAQEEIARLEGKL